VAQLLQHFRRAGEFGEWFRYAERAADLAVGAGDEATAVAVLHDVIAGADLPAVSLLRAMQKFPSLSIVDMARCRDLASALRRVLARQAVTPGEEGGLRSQLGRVLVQLEDFDAARRELEAAVSLLPGDSPEAARCLILLGGVPATHLPRVTALSWVRRAGPVLRRVDRREALGLSVDRIYALLRLGADEGWAEAAELEHGWDAHEQLQLGRLHGNVGYAAAVWGRYGDAARHYAAGRELAQAGQHGRLRALLDSTQLRLDWLTGRWDGLLDRAEAMAADPDERPGFRREGDLVAGMLLLATGDAAHGERRLRGVLDALRGHGGVEQFAEAAAALARSRLTGGAAGEAVDLTDEPARLVVAQEAWIWAAEIAPARVDALLAAGRAGEAAELTTVFSDGLGRCPAPAAGAAVLVCRAMLLHGDGQHGPAAEVFAQAATAWRGLPRPYDALLAEERQAACLIAAGQVPAGVRLLSEVFHGLAAMGARGDAVRLMPVLRGHGVEVRRPWWGGRRGHGAALTPRELDVVRLLVAGRTNREIAQLLFLSPKTIATHLNSAMRKFGVTSRTALAVRAVKTELTTPADD
jgi:DNA-binding CsgD family transcriptional regulator